jgi:hypothetical protein
MLHNDERESVTERLSATTITKTKSGRRERSQLLSINLFRGLELNSI